MSAPAFQPPRPTDETLAALMRLEGSADFQTLISHIAQQRRALAEYLVYQPEIANLRQAQGRSQALHELLETVRTARQVLETRRTASPPPRHR